MIDYMHFSCLGSTNSWVKNHISQFPIDRFTCVVAQEQTKGKGRLQRNWISPPSGNIYATLFFTLPISFSYLENISQLMAYSCLVTLKKYGILGEFKWPNDVLVQKKKLSGVLTEVVHLEHILGVIVGVGVNINMPESILQTISQPATSLLQLTGKMENSQVFLDSLLQIFIANLNQLQKEGFSSFAEILQSCLAYKNEQIYWIEGNQKIQGICHSITEKGLLKIALPKGAFRSFTSGEIQLYVNKSPH